MKKYLIGIDVGTTGTKSILFSDDGQVVARAYRSYPLINKRVGESEQNPHDWWRAIVETVNEVVTDGKCARDVVAISLSTQGGTLVPVDEEWEPVRPAIVWNDIRFTEEREKYLSEVGDVNSLYRKTGFKLGRGLPLLAIRYLKDKEPQSFSKTHKFLSVPSYVSVKMTGKCAVDFSNAGIEELFNLSDRDYDPALLAFAGVERDRLADPVPSGKVIGTLTESAAKQLGLKQSVVFVTGAHDQYAVSLGAGALNAGDILIGSGTSWVVVASNEKPNFDSGLSQSISAVPGLWGSLRSLSSGGVCLDWLRNGITIGKNLDLIGYDELDREVEKIKAAEDGLFFYPFKGTYGKSSFTKASFVGMDMSHDRYHLARAVMEGIVFQILWMLESFDVKPSEEGIKLSGGATKSKVWCQMLADVSGMRIRIPEISDLACVGAAILAGAGAGVYPNVKEGYEKFLIAERVVTPREEMTEIYRPIFEKYKKLAEALGDFC